MECEWEYAKGINIFRHRSTNLLVFSCDPHIKTWVSEDVTDAIYDFVTFIFKVKLDMKDKALFETCYAPDGFVHGENIEVVQGDTSLPDLGGL